MCSWKFQNSPARQEHFVHYWAKTHSIAGCHVLCDWVIVFKLLPLRSFFIVEHWCRDWVQLLWHLSSITFGHREGFMHWIILTVHQFHILRSSVRNVIGVIHRIFSLLVASEVAITLLKSAAPLLQKTGVLWLGMSRAKITLVGKKIFFAPC
jgi:hypothetical protein